MKEMIKVILQAFLDFVYLVPEKFISNKYFWIFLSVLVSLVTVIFAYVFM